MRNFIRIGLRVLMILILVTGCVHNIYHFKILSDRQVSYPSSYYNVPHHYGNDSYQNQYEEEEYGLH